MQQEGKEASVVNLCKILPPGNDGLRWFSEALEEFASIGWQPCQSLELSQVKSAVSYMQDSIELHGFPGSFNWQNSKGDG